jgi:hypothetical protein
MWRAFTRNDHSVNGASECRTANGACGPDGGVPRGDSAQRDTPEQTESDGNLSLTGSGTKTMPGTAMTIAGSFTVSGTASATAAAILTVNGNFSVGSGTTFVAGAFAHVVEGNFSNKGTFTAGASSTFTFSGSSQPSSRDPD